MPKIFLDGYHLFRSTLIMVFSHEQLQMPLLAFIIMQRILFSRVTNLFKITIPTITCSERLGWRFQKRSSSLLKSTVWVPNQPPNSNSFFFVPWWLICHVLRSDSHDTQMRRRNCVRHRICGDPKVTNLSYVVPTHSSGDPDVHSCPLLV